MNKCLPVCLAFVCLFSAFCFGQSITARRALPIAYEPGGTLQVQLNLEVDEANLPSGVIVTEFVPVGWNLFSSNPAHSRFISETGEIKWEFHEIISDTSMDITYVVQIPQAATGAKEFQGTVRWIDASGFQYENSISGDRFTSDGQPVFHNLRFFTPDGQALSLGAVPVDIAFRVAADYVSPSNTALASSEWQVIKTTDQKTVFAATVNSGDLTSCWLPSLILQPATDYVVKGQATDSLGRTSEVAETRITTVNQNQTRDSDGNGIPDEQEPDADDFQFYGYSPELPLPPDTKITDFNGQAVLVESPDGYSVTYFSGVDAGAPSGWNAPYGIFLTRLEEVPVGSAVRLRFLFPEVLPAGARWYKYDETRPEPERWKEFPGVEIKGNLVIVSLTDGGSGDADGVANGVIVDPAGPLVRKSSDGGPCFIATAAFGSPLAREVEILSLFRDKVLLKCQMGKAFVAWYYRHSPAVAAYLREKVWLRLVVRGLLYPLVWLVTLIGAGLFPFLFSFAWLLTILRRRCPGLRVRVLTNSENFVKLFYYKRGT
ncbi:MAG: hypothetical protein NC911_09740 [Candidatus Omnitrophica bacterium]|nr:hypothetical protein [Candidatus Omnitrophota bacterium]